MEKRLISTRSCKRARSGSSTRRGCEPRARGCRRTRGGTRGGESVAILGDLSRAHAKCSNENENENVLKMHRGMKLKGQWTADEDALLTELVDKYGTTRWSEYRARAVRSRREAVSGTVE